jgi:DNA repair ATPase RecN
MTDQSGLKEKKKLDEVLDNRTRMIVDELLEKRLGSMLTDLKDFVTREKHSSLLMVDEELNKFSEKVGQSLGQLNQQISAVDMECGTLMRTLIDKKVVATKELEEKYGVLSKEVADTMKKMKEHLEKQKPPTGTQLDKVKAAGTPPVVVQPAVEVKPTSPSAT